MSAEQKSLGEMINTWTQTVAIILAGLWAVYTFVYKEIIEPKAAPVNISMKLEVDKIDPAAASSKDLTAVEMKVSATNPSTREIHLLASAWTAYAMSVSATELDLSKENETARRISTPRNIITLERHARKEGATLVALGQLYGDVSLKPGESVVRRIVFFVPRNRYDLLEVRASIPSAPNVDGVGFEWIFEDDSLQPKLLRVDRAGKKTDVPEAEQISFAECRDIQTSETRAEVSLWP